MCHRCPPPCKVSCLSTTTRHMSEATSTQVHTTIWQLKDLKATERFMCQSTVMLNAHRSSTAEHVFVVRQHRSSTAEHCLFVFGLCYVLCWGIYSEQFFYVLIFTDHGPTINTVHETWSGSVRLKQQKTMAPWLPCTSSGVVSPKLAASRRKR